MPPKGWTSGRPEGIVKAVRLTEETIDRIALHISRLQEQLSFVRVNEGMAIRNLIEVGLDTVEAKELDPVEMTVGTGAPSATKTPNVALTPPPAPETPNVAPDPETGPSQPAHLSAVPVGMKQCKHGHEPYPMGRGECPTCVRNRKRRQRQPIIKHTN